MRLVCIDHFFGQDIDALRDARGEHACWSVPYHPFLAAAQEVFPEEVWTGIETFFKPEHAAARQHYAQIAGRMVDELYEVYRPDAFCAPSDTFFWIRAAIERSRALGVPFVVLQKEATIPPGWLEGPAQEWGRMSPFIADHMLVSSANHATFWINGGVEPSIVDVTGQPRFDIYASPRTESRSAGIPTVLFLTYDVNAYMPVIDRTGMAPWQELRDQTEAVLLKLAGERRARVLIKGHPQPAEDQTAHLAELSRHEGIEIADPQADVRHLIRAADVVVGFQTTALLESLAARRPTIYTWWSNTAESYADDLIPFHRETDALDVATSPAQLRAAIERALDGVDSGAQDRTSAATALVETYIGRVDGHAAKRCWAIMARLATAAAGVPNPERSQLLARWRRRRRRQLTQAAVAKAIWTAGARAVSPGYPLYRSVRERVGDGVALEEQAFRRELNERRRMAAERLEAATAA
jgi:hypothetical protein